MPPERPVEQQVPEPSPEELGEAGLEESIREYERGTKLLTRCREILGRAEQRIEKLDGETLAAHPEAGPPDA